MRARIAIALLVAGALASGALAAPSSAAKHSHHKPNIVFVLTDDLSWDLVTPRFAPHIVKLQDRGTTFTRYFVSNSLCCPSRATIFTGLFPHNSGVLANLGPDGGFQKFQAQRLDGRTYAVALRGRGYATSFMGKYLNGYGDPMTPALAPIPPGWTDWHVSNSTGYLEFNYLLNDNGTVNTYGGPTGACGVETGPSNYGVDVLNAKARSFIGGTRGQPFAIEVATFSPHAPYTPAPRDACDFPNLSAPRDPSFNAANTNAPAWLAAHGALGPRQVAAIDTSFRMRAQSVEAIDKLVADLERSLAARHLLRNTYIVFSSDNGYHLGQHRLIRGKQTAFDTDIRVPLIVAGPGVPKGRKVARVAQNTDLYPTFLDLAGARPSRDVDGRSLVPLLHPTRALPRWRTVALVEHNHLVRPGDPDFEDGRRGGDPPTYKAIRISSPRVRGFRGPVEAVYVEYDDPAHEVEYYDIRRDPFERHNVAERLTATQRRELHRILARLGGCRGSNACWQAGLPAP
jgi:N-acetylglucosamine-6-sulfatase